MPQFSPLPAFLADLSQSTQPFSKHPDFMLRGRAHVAAKTLHASRGGNLGGIVKALALRALIWLLRADLVDQLHVRLRLQVRPQIKAAWRSNKQHASRERFERLEARGGGGVPHASVASSLAQTSTDSEWPPSSSATPADRARELPQSERPVASSLSHVWPPPRSTQSPPLDRDEFVPHSSALGLLPRGTHPAASGGSGGGGTAPSYPRPSGGGNLRAQLGSEPPTEQSMELAFVRRPVAPADKSPPPSFVSITSSSSHHGRGRMSQRPDPPTAAAPTDPRQSTRMISPQTRTQPLPGSMGTTQSEPPAARRLLSGPPARSVSRPRKVIRGFGHDEQVAIHYGNATNVPVPCSPRRLSHSGTSANGSHRGTPAVAGISAARPGSSLARSVRAAPAPPRSSTDQVSARTSPVVGTSEPVAEDARRMSAATGHSSLLAQPPLEPMGTQGSESPYVRPHAHLLEEPELCDADWNRIPIHEATIIKEPTQMTWYEGEWVDLILEQASSKDQEGLDDPLHAGPRGSAAASLLRRLLPYLNGKHSLDEIALREDLRRREIRLVRETFKDDLIEFLHP